MASQSVAVLYIAGAGVCQMVMGNI